MISGACTSANARLVCGPSMAMVMLCGLAWVNVRIR
ncbi:hypothetical protein APX70_200009 [Pseudomonas syringae pv. maculicola]|uniref:Uncharacterized protein n=1 Tax=Pseudomonas syringae pv. maculicola TaxID=59511 RepID=A0A3M2ZUT0_PSEYM|nr:hypothetical protein APX70_200009 [Pseudomonas syringae pv. maculicola]